MTDSTENELRGVYAEEVVRFVKSINDYCAFLETAGSLEAMEFIKKVLQLSAEVYASALDLKAYEPVLENGNEKFVTEQDWSSVYQVVLQLLGSHNTYLRIAEDEEFDRSDLVTHTISEDLADVYQDVKDFSLQYRQGVDEIMNDAIYEVMESFEQYWSTKILQAMQALNQLYIKKVDPIADAEDPDAGIPGNNPKYDNSLFTRLQDRNEEDV